jgi:Leu/Phe-tRNA-protein transferase
LLDTQWMTPHLRQFGGYELTRHQYTAALREVLAVEAGASPL